MPKKTSHSPHPTLNVNTGNWMNRILIGHPMTGLIRVEWMMGRFGQTIPCNWSHVDLIQFMSPYVPLKYQVADAENLIAKAVVEGDVEWCFPAKTLVETISGARDIRDIQVGDSVLTHMGRMRPVVKKYIKSITQRSPMTWIKTENSVIKTTPNHPFLVKRNGVLQFIESKLITAGDLLCYPNLSTEVRYLDFNIRYNSKGEGYNGLAGGHRNSVSLDSVPVDESVARFMGLYLAEGHATKDGIVFTLNNKEKDLIDFVSGFSESVFGRKAILRKRWAAQLTLSIRNLSSLFGLWFNGKAKTKRVPGFVFSWSIKNKLAFLRGYFDGDGTENCGMVTFSSASRELVYDIRELCQQCGLKVRSVNTSRQPAARELQDGRVITQGGPIYSSGITVKSNNKMKDLLSSRLCDDSYHYIEVSSTEEHKWAASLKDNNVYNLEVSEDNSYIADGVAVHNCLMWEHDNIPPADALVRLNQYMLSGKVPVVAGVYFTKSVPPEPLVYRGTGNSYFNDWRLGDKVWCSGIPFGFTMIHGSIIKAMWEESPEYIVNSQITRRVFDAPSKSWRDTEKGVYVSQGGTSDLAWCKRVMDEGFFEKAGWPQYQKKEFPFLIDTGIFVRHIDNDGRQFPLSIPKQFAPHPKGKVREIR